ncbi:MAG TPA: hypothetical protein VH682_04105 [Gemmataceae bacterium]
MAAVNPTPSTPGADVPRSGRPRRQNLFWSRLHFGIRLLGLTGAFLTCVAAVLAAVRRELLPLADVTSVQQAYDVVVGLARQALEDPQAHISMLLLLGGILAALFALLIEAVVGLGFSASRRSAFGFNSLLQGALAAALLVGVNVWSFSHYLRIDYTRDRQFTLPADVRAELSQLDPDSKTTVIVYQRHKTFGALSGKPPDDYDSAAERKIVEKVKDLTEQFRAVGPRINVEVLDVQARDYKGRLAEITENAAREPQPSDESKDDRDKRLKRQAEQAASLRKAIESAAENSLFFYAHGANDKPYVQRLSFNDFYLLDKTASQEDRDNRGNLVLLYQGVQPFANRLLHLEEKRPRIGLAVIHPVLSSVKDHDWGLKGLRQALESRGFQVEDIVLKKWSRFAPPSAAAATVDESALDRLKERQKVLERLIDGLERERPVIDKAAAVWRKAAEDPKERDELTRKLADKLGDRKVTAEMAQLQAALLQAELENLDKALPVYRQRLEENEAEKKKLNVPALEEQQRMTDVKAKMDRLLAGCDLLIVPRMTLRNVADERENISARFYLDDQLKLDAAQVEAIKDFLKSGKPVLACFGPTNTAPDEGMTVLRPDGVEELLGQIGVKLGKETVLFDAEVEALADSRAGADLGGAQFEAPPVLFDWATGAGRPVGVPPLSDKPNRIRESLRLIARALGKDEEGKELPLDIRIRHPRPIYFVPPKETTLARDVDFLMTNPRSWNEDRPFPTDDSVPQFEKSKKRDKGDALKEASKDPYEARRRGPFPIGVAVETPLPAAWYGSAADKPATVRLAVIGQGGFFTGKELPPAQEELFVTTINWLLSRDDRLPNAEHTWNYPRVNDTIPPDSEREYLWLWGVRLGLPVLFAYFGFVMLLFRRLR